VFVCYVWSVLNERAHREDGDTLTVFECADTLVCEHVVFEPSVFGLDCWLCMDAGEVEAPQVQLLELSHPGERNVRLTVRWYWEEQA